MTTSRPEVPTGGIIIAHVPLNFAEYLTTFRREGWTVAAHNDYHQNGQWFTFWLFTRANVCVKGEGSTDLEALQRANAEIAKLGVIAPVMPPEELGAL